MKSIAAIQRLPPLMLVVAAATLAVPVRGDVQDENRELRERLQRLEALQRQTLAEVDRLRARLDEAEGAGTPLAPAAAEPETALAPDLDILSGARREREIEMHGHLAVSYFGFEEQSLAPDGSRSRSLSDLNPQSSFAVSDVTLFFGVPIADSLYAIAELEYELGGDEISLDQAFFEWEASEALRLRVGKFYVPFGIERFYQNAPTNPLVDRPAPYIHVIPGTYSDTGISLGGHRSLSEGPETVFEYEVFLANGLGASLFDSARDARQNRDNNSSKAWGGRLGLRWDRWLSVGGSFMSGESDDSDEDEYQILGADLRADLGPFFLRAEYLLGEIDTPDLVDANGTPCSDASPLCPGLVPPLRPTGGSIHRRGWYVEGSWRHRPDLFGRSLDLQWVARIDDLDEDDSVRDLLDARRYSAGLVLRPLDHLRLKLQYEVTDEDPSEFDNNAVLLEGSVDW